MIHAEHVLGMPAVIERLILTCESQRLHVTECMSAPEDPLCNRRRHTYIVSVNSVRAWKWAVCVIAEVPIFFKYLLSRHYSVNKQ